MSERSTTTDLALIAVFAALIAACALVPAVQIPGLSVPFTLQTLGVALTGMVLGAKRGFLASGLYVLAGLAGLPIFAGYTGGLGVLGKPTVGYLLAFPLAAAAIGAVAAATAGKTRRWVWLVLAGLAGSFLFVHPLGILGMMRNAHLSAAAAFKTDVVFWPWDLVKTMLAAGIAVTVHKAFPALLPPRRRPATA